MRVASVVSRLVLTGVLLVVVWFHAHWSVALCLTLMSVNQELIAVITKWER